MSKQPASFSDFSNLGGAGAGAAPWMNLPSKATPLPVALGGSPRSVAPPPSVGGGGGGGGGGGPGGGSWRSENIVSERSKPAGDRDWGATRSENPRSGIPQSGGGQSEWDRRDRDRQQQRQPQQFQRNTSQQAPTQQRNTPQQAPTQQQNPPEQRWERHWQRDRDARGGQDDRSRNRGGGGGGGGGERRMYGKDQLLSHYAPMRKFLMPSLCAARLRSCLC